MKMPTIDDFVVPEFIHFGKAVSSETGSEAEDLMLIRIGGRYWPDFADDLDIPHVDQPQITLAFTPEALVEFIGQVGARSADVSDTYRDAVTDQMFGAMKDILTRAKARTPATPAPPTPPT